MPRILFSLCLLVWLGVPAPAVRAAPPADYFPLVPGTVWIYRTNIGQDLIMTAGRGGPVGGLALRGAGAEQVTVPAGTYATVQLYLEGSVAQERVQSWRWFAPGVGMVKEDSGAQGSGGRGIRDSAELSDFP